MAGDGAGLIRAGEAEGAGDAEVGDLHLSVARDEQVGRADVPVDDAEEAAVGGARGGVRVGEAGQDLVAEVDDEARRESELCRPGALHEGLEGEAGDELHGQEIGAVDAAKVEDLNDVGVNEARGELGLVAKEGDEARLRGQVGGECA